MSDTVWRSVEAVGVALLGSLMTTVAWAAGRYMKDQKTLQEHTHQISELQGDVDELKANDQKLLDGVAKLTNQMTAVSTNVDWIKKTMQGKE